MKTTQCAPQEISKFMMGLVMLVAAAALVVIGITLMPIFGLTMAVPVTVIAIYIFRLRLNDQCKIDFTDQ